MITFEVEDGRTFQFNEGEKVCGLAYNEGLKKWLFKPFDPSLIRAGSWLDVTDTELPCYQGLVGLKILDSRDFVRVVRVTACDLDPTFKQNKVTS